MKKAIEIDPIKIKSLYQIPAINKEEEEILKAPTKFLSKSEYPNSLNSLTTFSYLNVHTKNTDNDTISENSIDTCNIN